MQEFTKFNILPKFVYVSSLSMNNKKKKSKTQMHKIDRAVTLE